MQHCFTLIHYSDGPKFRVGQGERERARRLALLFLRSSVVRTSITCARWESCCHISRCPGFPETAKRLKDPLKIVFPVNAWKWYDKPPGFVRVRARWAWSKARWCLLHYELVAKFLTCLSVWYHRANVADLWFAEVRVCILLPNIPSKKQLWCRLFSRLFVSWCARKSLGAPPWS